MKTTSVKQIPAFLFYVIWISMTGSLIIYWEFLSTGFPEPNFPDAIPLVEPAFLLSITSGIGAIILRVICQKLTDRIRMFSLFVAGCAMSESITFFALFLSKDPENQAFLGYGSLILILLFCPLFILKKQTSLNPFHPETRQ